MKTTEEIAISPAEASIAHSMLVEIAAAWLRRKCAVVITELITSGEAPDAIGWNGAHSTLIECKVSRADFFADRNKCFRRESSMGIGVARYYLTPSGLIDLSEVPEKWGLLELAGSKIKVKKKSEAFSDVNSRHEISLLLSTLRRVGHCAPKPVSIRCYTIETKNTASLGLLAEESEFTPPTHQSNNEKDEE